MQTDTVHLNLNNRLRFKNGNCSYECAYKCAQLKYITEHNTVLSSSPIITDQMRSSGSNGYSKIWCVLPPSSLDDGGCKFSGLPCSCPYITYFACSSISLLGGGISMKLARNIPHVCANCWKDFQGQWVKGQGHAATIMEIMCTWHLIAEGTWTKTCTNVDCQSRIFYRWDALPDAQCTMLIQWRYSLYIIIIIRDVKIVSIIEAQLFKTEY